MAFLNESASYFNGSRVVSVFPLALSNKCLFHLIIGHCFGMMGRSLKATCKRKQLHRTVSLVVKFTSQKLDLFIYFFPFRVRFFGNQRRFGLELKGLDYDIVAKYVSRKSPVPDFLRMFDYPQKTQPQLMH